MAEILRLKFQFQFLNFQGVEMLPPNVHSGRAIASQR